MSNSKRKIFMSIFTITCTIFVTCMMSYWFYKYGVEDRDIGVVDYAQLSDAENIEFPIASLCFRNPFIKKVLLEMTDGIYGNSNRLTDFRQYLKGELHNNTYKAIDYQNSTLDLADYYLYLKEEWYNSSRMQNSSLIVEHQEVFSGFFKGSFMKCFRLKHDVASNYHIKAVRLYYDLKKLLDDWRDYGSKLKYYLKLHYPGQFLLGDDPRNAYLDDVSLSLTAWIKDYEILERRNTKKKKCTEETTSYDKMIMEKYFATVECRLPYLTNRELSLCNTTERMKDARFDYLQPEILRIPKACKRVSKMRYTTQTGGKNYQQRREWSFTLYYPKEVKVIAQSKEVDFHSLIGNIGGYIGLFLGMIEILQKYLNMINNFLEVHE